MNICPWISPGGPPIRRHQSFKITAVSTFCLDESLWPALTLPLSVGRVNCGTVGCCNKCLITAAAKRSPVFGESKSLRCLLQTHFHLIIVSGEGKMLFVMLLPC